MRFAIINGPNLNLLGKREPEIYGSKTFEEYLEQLRSEFPKVEFYYFQSNVEGEIINEIQRAGFSMDGIILNPGGYTHTSVAIADAVAAVPSKVVEVHISNIHKREEVRRVSLISAYCDGSIAGLGLTGYSFAVEFLLSKIS